MYFIVSTKYIKYKHQAHPAIDQTAYMEAWKKYHKGGYTLVTLPRILVTPYRRSVDETRARVTYRKLVTR
jgi:hypothetical protein